MYGYEVPSRNLEDIYVLLVAFLRIASGGPPHVLYELCELFLMLHQDCVHLPPSGLFEISTIKVPGNLFTRTHSHSSFCNREL